MRPHPIIGKLLVFSAVVLTTALAPEPDAQGLPPEIQVDRLLVQAEREIEDGEHWSAVATFERILAVCEEHELEIPVGFWFRQAGVLQGAGLHERAIEASTRYLQEAGRDGEHYRAALEILDAAEVGLAEARRAEARARAAAERAEREAAAAEARAAAEYRTLRDGLASVEGVFADALQSGGLGPAMITVPAGRFRMGCLSGDGSCTDTEKPVHRVTIPRPFGLSVHEVMFAEWDACVAAGGCGGHRPSDEGLGRGTRPVVDVSWDEAQEYVGWLSVQTGVEYRLPSEAEWEYAARAGTTTKYSWGNGLGVNRANCASSACGDSWEHTAPAGSFRPNGFGLYDTHGNVMEWVEDCWNEGYHGAPSDGGAWLQGDCSDRVMRGGSWRHNAWGLRAAVRLYYNFANRYDRYDHVGFRVARTLTP